MGLIVRPGMVVGFYVYNKLFDTPRARVILIDDQQRLFLVRHWGSYREWSIPGGGTNKHESPLQAAGREIKEELGVTIAPDRFSHLTTIRLGYVSEVYVAILQPSELPPQPFNRREIVETGWFAPGALPRKVSQIARIALDTLSKQTKI